MSEKIVCSHCGKKTAKLLKCQICGSTLREEDLEMDGMPSAGLSEQAVDASAILADVDTILEDGEGSARPSGLRVKRDVVGASNPENPADMIAVNPGEKTLFADEEEDLIAGIEELADSGPVPVPASPVATPMPESQSATMKSSKDPTTTPSPEPAASIPEPQSATLKPRAVSAAEPSPEDATPSGQEHADAKVTERAKRKPEDPVQPEPNVKSTLEPVHFKQKEDPPTAEVEPSTAPQKLTARLEPMKAESAKSSTPETEPKSKAGAKTTGGGLKPRGPAPVSGAKNDTARPGPREEKPGKAKAGTKLKPESSLGPAPLEAASMAEEPPRPLEALDDKAETLEEKADAPGDTVGMLAPGKEPGSSGQETLIELGKELASEDVDEGPGIKDTALEEKGDQERAEATPSLMIKRPNTPVDLASHISAETGDPCCEEETQNLDEYVQALEEEIPSPVDQDIEQSDEFKQLVEEIHGLSNLDEDEVAAECDELEPLDQCEEEEEPVAAAVEEREAGSPSSIGLFARFADARRRKQSTTGFVEEARKEKNVPVMADSGLADLETAEFENLRHSSIHGEVLEQMRDTSWFARNQAAPVSTPAPTPEEQASEGDHATDDDLAALLDADTVFESPDELASLELRPPEAKEAEAKREASEDASPVYYLDDETRFGEMGPGIIPGAGLDDNAEGIVAEESAEASQEEDALLETVEQLLKETTQTDPVAEPAIADAEDPVVGDEDEAEPVPEADTPTEGPTGPGEKVEEPEASILDSESLKQQVKLISCISRSGLDPESTLAAYLLALPELAFAYVDAVKGKTGIEKIKLNNELNYKLEHLDSKDTSAARELIQAAIVAS